MSELVAGPRRVAFVGERKDFARIVWRGTGLELLTAGFYRFWLATRMRRHLWSNTIIVDDPLEYTGNARELLIGFFFALAILAPFYLFYFLAGLIAESLKPFASTPLIVAFYFLSLFAAFRARRYRLQRTVWRGLRFRMGGSGIGYMFRAAGWSMLVVLTLGLLLPWREAALERYKMRFTSYGSLQGTFVGTGGQLFKAGWKLWAGALVVIALLILISLGFASLGRGYRASLAVPIALGFCVGVPFWWAAFKSELWRWRIGGMRFGDVSFTSDIESGAFSARYWAMIGWVFLFAIIVYFVWGLGFAGVASWLGGVPVQTVIKSPVGIVIAFAPYVLVVLAYNIVLRMNLVHDIWQHLVQSISITGLDDITSRAGADDTSTAVGEGLSSGLDIGGF